MNMHELLLRHAMHRLVFPQFVRGRKLTSVIQDGLGGVLREVEEPWTETTTVYALAVELVVSGA